MHWAAGYPTSKRPRNVKDNAVIFMGRLTRDPNDIRVFGWAIGMQHKRGRDDATLADIELRPWKEQWSRYIRVDRAEFVAGTMMNGVSLNELMDTLEADHLRLHNAMPPTAEGIQIRDLHIDNRRLSNSLPKVTRGSASGFRSHLKSMARFPKIVSPNWTAGPLFISHRIALSGRISGSTTRRIGHQLFGETKAVLRIRIRGQEFSKP